MGFMGSPPKSGDRGHLSGGHPGGNCGRGKIQPETNEYDGQRIRAKAGFYGVGDRSWRAFLESAPEHRGSEGPAKNGGIRAGGKISRCPAPLPSLN